MTPRSEHFNASDFCYTFGVVCGAALWTAAGTSVAAGQACGSTAGRGRAGGRMSPLLPLPRGVTVDTVRRARRAVNGAVRLTRRSAASAPDHALLLPSSFRRTATMFGVDALDGLCLATLNSSVVSSGECGI